MFRKMFHGVAALTLVVSVFIGQYAPLFGVAGLTVVVVTQTACPSSDSIAETAGQVARYADGAITIFRSNGQSTTRLEQVKSYALKVQSAFENGNPTNGAELAAELIKLFNLVTNDAQLIQNSTTRTIVLVALFAVNEAIQRLAERMEKAAPASVKSGSMRGTPTVSTIAEFQKRPKWRCRNSETGRFAEMDYCKANPSTSQVETYQR